MPRIRHDKIDPAAVATRFTEFDPGVIDIFGTSIPQGFRNTNTVVALTDTLKMAPARQFTEEEMRRFGLSESEIANELEWNKTNRTLSQDEWEASPHAREGKKWFEGMTEAQAKMLADRADREEEAVFMQSRAKGFLENSAIFIGNLIGSIPDPINFIPILGVAGRAVLAAKLGRFGGAVTVGAVEAGVATALVQPLFALRARSFQERYDLEMAATDVGMSLLVGAGFGSIAGAIGRTSDALKSTATAKAARDLMDGNPVDVNGVLGDIVDGTPLIREGMNFEGPTSARGPLVERMGAADNRLRAEEVLRSALKPRNQRTARDALLLRALDLSPEARAAVRIVRKPGVLRTADEKFTLDAFRKGKEAELIGDRMKADRGKLAETEAKLERAKTEKSKAKLEATAARLRGRIADGEERLRDLGQARPLNSTVADRASPEQLEVEPTTPKNARALPDIDDAETNELTRRVAELDEAEGLLSDERKLLEDSADFEARTNKYAEAYQDAAACMAGGG